MIRIVLLLSMLTAACVSPPPRERHPITIAQPGDSYCVANARRFNYSFMNNEAYWVEAAIRVCEREAEAKALRDPEIEKFCTQEHLTEEQRREFPVLSQENYTKCVLNYPRKLEFPYN